MFCRGGRGDWPDVGELGGGCAGASERVGLVISVFSECGGFK